MLRDGQLPINVVSNSKYTVYVVQHIETEHICHSNNVNVFQLFSELQLQMRQRQNPIYITHTHSHTHLPGGITAGNAI